MDEISLWDAIHFYYLLFSPLLTTIVLLFWIATTMKSNAKGKSIVFSIIALQFAYSILFFTLLGLESNIAIALLCIIPLISILLLYPWTFGRKKTAKGRVFVILIFIVQVILVILTFILSLIAYR